MPADKIGEQLQTYIAAGGFHIGEDACRRHGWRATRVCREGEAARLRFGPDVQLMVDAHGTYNVGDAKRFVHLVSYCDLTWFEGPVIADDRAGRGEVRA